MAVSVQCVHTQTSQITETNCYFFVQPTPIDNKLSIKKLNQNETVVIVIHVVHCDVERSRDEIFFSLFCSVKISQNKSSLVKPPTRKWHFLFICGNLSMYVGKIFSTTCRLLLTVKLLDKEFDKVKVDCALSLCVLSLMLTIVQHFL